MYRFFGYLLIDYYLGRFVFQAIVELLKNLWATDDVRKVAEGVLAAEFIWGEDLNAVPGLTDLLTADLALIQAEGMRAAVKSVI